MSQYDVVHLTLLVAKYVEMRELRRLDATNALADPRARMRALAEQFPGALREIDSLPMHEIESRIEELQRAHADRSSKPWMDVMARFHEDMRVALRLKRAIKNGITDELRRAHDSWSLEQIANPPRGKLSVYVCARIAESMGITPDAVRAYVFTSRPSKACSASSKT